jgi:hypothetical protein
MLLRLRFPRLLDVITRIRAFLQSLWELRRDTAKSRPLGLQLVPMSPRRSVNAISWGKGLGCSFGAAQEEWFDRRANNAEEKSSVLSDPTPRRL